ncbi:MAG: TIGR04076 family protein, partial [Nitrospinota bacterium]
GKCRQGYGGAWTVGETGAATLCPFLFHAAYPYFVTLLNGGWFPWVPAGGTVIAQCGNPEGAVELEIGREVREDSTVVFARIRKVRGICPQGYESGQAFAFTMDELPCCPKAAGAFIPYLAFVAQGGELPWKDAEGTPVLCCPDVSCDAVFTIGKDWRCG